jgi:hypothetical protein
MGRNALAVALRYAGPLGMLKGLGEANPPKFYSPCEVCYYIATRKKEELGQLTAESFIKRGPWGDVAWDVVAFYVWIALMLYVYNEVYPIVSRRALLYFLATAGAAAGAAAALL